MIWKTTTTLTVGVPMNLQQYLEFQAREIERHKWIESEKAGRDLGMDAVIDWILKYADVFSDRYLTEIEKLPDERSPNASTG